MDTLASPVDVTLPGTVAQIGTSNSTDYALLTDGSLYAWGLGSQGELGDGSLRNSLNVPVRVRFPAGVRIASIPADAMPFDTGLAVDTNGNVWGWGNNGGGELCLGNSKLYTTPARLPLTDVTTVAGASTHALYDSAGTVYACGQNLDGDLGDGSWHSTRTPVAVTRFDGRDVVKLVASFANSGALLSNGKYFDWGYNGAGQLGDGITGKASDVPVRVHLPHPVSPGSPGRVHLEQRPDAGQAVRWLAVGLGQQPGRPARPRGAGRQVAAGPLLRPGRGAVPEPGHRLGHVVRGVQHRERLRVGSQLRRPARRRVPEHHADSGPDRHRGQRHLVDREQRAHQVTGEEGARRRRTAFAYLLARIAASRLRRLGRVKK